MRGERGAGVWERLSRLVALWVWLVALGVWLAAAGTVLAEERVEPEAAQPSEARWTRPLLFEVRSEAGTTTLLGTFHIGVDLAEAPAAILERFEASSIYAMEVDLTAASIAALQFMTQPDGASLREQLGDSLWAELEQRLPDAVAFEHHRPWVVSTLLLVQMIPGGRTVEGMDGVLLERARREPSAYELVFLETPQRQFEVIDQVLDLESLAKMLQDWDEEVARVEALRLAYLAGDLEALEAGVLRADLDDEERADLVLLLDERNAAWLPQLESLIARGDAFVAFGAAHLVGPGGVLELLRAKGYTVVRVEQAGASE